ncbi:MAG: haloacid dehalogenase-like hydrolase [Firmicutes bacterium]|nr:haloacid dehalogenase-like hydrolase [Bacillota bacterium]
MPKKSNADRRALPKKMFSALFAFIMDFLNIRATTIVELDGANDVNTVSSWRTRVAPQLESDLDKLIRVLILRSQQKGLQFGAVEYTIDSWKTGVLFILAEFNIQNPQLVLKDIFDSNADIEANIKKLMHYAYSKKAVVRPDKADMQGKTNMETSEELYFQPGKRLVIFDLDGTLIKGIKYSWTLLYQSVGIDPNLCNINKKRFQKGEITYPEWCEYDLRELQTGGLTLEIAKNAVERNCSLTRNFHQAIRLLKSFGFVVAIISGGANVILHSLIPDAESLFGKDIFINKLVFDEVSGELVNIIPTKYDWDSDDGLLGVEGKDAALKLLCEKYNITFDSERGVYNECVFVGDDDNDFKAMRLSGLKILYCSSSPEDKTYGTGSVRSIPEGIRIINENNLMSVATMILEYYGIET